MTIFALTEMHSQDYPAFINVTEVKPGVFKLIVRERGNGGNKFAHIEINEDQVRNMALELLDRVHAGAAIEARIAVVNWTEE